MVQHKKISKLTFFSDVFFFVGFDVRLKNVVMGSTVLIAGLWPQML